MVNFTGFSVPEIGQNARCPACHKRKVLNSSKVLQLTMAIANKKFNY